jgi:hypothetical protein
MLRALLFSATSCRICRCKLSSPTCRPDWLERRPELPPPPWSMS